MSRFTHAANLRYHAEEFAPRSEVVVSRRRQRTEARAEHPKRYQILHDLPERESVHIPDYYQQRRNTPQTRKRKFGEATILPSLMTKTNKYSLVKLEIHNPRESSQLKRRHRTAADVDREDSQRQSFSGTPSPENGNHRLIQSKRRKYDGHVSVHIDSYMDEFKPDSATGNPQTNQTLNAYLQPQATFKNIMALENNFARLQQRMKKVRPLMFPTTRKQLTRYYQQFKQTTQIMQQLHELVE